ncbi:MAG: hypothetical protein AB1452_06710 [Pseudomonadota bacterium]
MPDPTIRIALAAACACFLQVAAPVVYAQQFGTGAFPRTDSIEKQLRRGASTRADVQRLLGVPNGAGRGDMARPAGMATPPMGDGPREIWFYDDVEVTDMKSDESAVTMKLRQQILLVFFKGDIFDGYLWTSNVFTPTASQ